MRINRMRFTCSPADVGHAGHHKRRGSEGDSEARSYILSVRFVISRVNYFFSEGAVPPGTVPSNFRISPFRPTAQPW
jgi:hypothetical protein